MDILLTLLSVAGVTYVMGIPGSDDIMLNYQTTSFHDALYVRNVLGLQPAPEFAQWLVDMGLWEAVSPVRLARSLPAPFQGLLARLN
jgi:ethanolamine ammonia-lyase large subunit